MIPLPTLADQRAAGLETDITDQIRQLIRREYPSRALPPGVYAANGRLVAAFRRVDSLGERHYITVASGAGGDYSRATADDLAGRCARAAANWDRRHGR